MTDFKAKVERWQRMQEITEQACSSMRASLYPLLSLFSSRIYEITEVSRGWSSRFVTVEHVDHGSGGPYHHQINIPLEVWNADDPIAAAHAYKAELKAEQEQSSRQATVDAIAALQKKLETMP